jgi:hypothetical protein
MKTIMERQIEYMETTKNIKTIVTNGLSTEIREIKEKISSVCENYDSRLKDLEKFKWFRDAMESFRNNWFFYTILVLFTAIIIISVMHITGEKFVSSLLKVFGI